MDLKNVAHKPVRGRGFTLIELLVVLVVLGLLAGLVGPQVMKHLGESKVKTAKLQIEEIAVALDMFRIDVDRYPTTEENLAALVQRPGDVATTCIANRARMPSSTSIRLVPINAKAATAKIPISSAGDERHGSAMRTFFCSDLSLNDVATRLEPAVTNRGPRAGFTLIELLVVLVLMSAVIMLALPSFSGSLQTLRTREAAREVYGLLRLARSEAITWARPAVVVIDAGARQVSLTDNPASYTIPSGLVLANDHGHGEPRQVAFFPDGSSTGGTFALTGSGKRFQFHVEPLTGEVTIDVQGANENSPR